ncbi:MAG: hypothetical protein IKN72_12205 [Clostridia bacterium]|nr:hypothetical protein [Clostridia bacterium]
MKKRMIILAVFTIVLALVLTGCGKGGNYKKATALYEEGKYQEAAEMFADLGDYEDSAEMAKKSQYEAAKALFASASYEDARNAFSQLGEYADSKAYLADCDHQIMMQTYADVITALDGKTWYFNGGADNVLNSIVFSGESATISQVYFDGNREHDNGSNEHPFVVNDQMIVVTMDDGSELAIAYNLSGSQINLGEKKYFTPEEVDKGIQGYWKERSSVLGGESEYNICFDHGNVISESASEAYGSTSGEYYYYGPYEGTYTLNFGGFDTEMRHGMDWFFNIIDGEVAVLHFGDVCTKTDKLPGENGYKF